MFLSSRIKSLNVYAISSKRFNGIQMAWWCVENVESSLDICNVPIKMFTCFPNTSYSTILLDSYISSRVCYWKLINYKTNRQIHTSKEPLHWRRKHIYATLTLKRYYFWPMAHINLSQHNFLFMYFSATILWAYLKIMKSVSMISWLFPFNIRSIVSKLCRKIEKKKCFIHRNFW